MSVTSAVASVAEALAGWLDPKRRERATLLRAIEAAEQLLLILRKKGRYEMFTQAKLKEYEVHYQKQFDRWRDGTS